MIISSLQASGDKTQYLGITEVDKKMLFSYAHHLWGSFPTFKGRSDKQYHDLVKLYQIMILFIALIVAVNICLGTCAYHFAYVNESYREMVVTGIVLPIVRAGPTPVIIDNQVNAAESLKSGRKRVLISGSSTTGVVGSVDEIQVQKTSSYSTPDGPTTAMLVSDKESKLEQDRAIET